MSADRSEAAMYIRGKQPEHRIDKISALGFSGRFHRLTVFVAQAYEGEGIVVENSITHIDGSILYIRRLQEGESRSYRLLLIVPAAGMCLIFRS